MGLGFKEEGMREVENFGDRTVGCRLEGGREGEVGKCGDRVEGNGALCVSDEGRRGADGCGFLMSFFRFGV